MKRLITFLSLLIITQLAFGQLSGTFSIPGDYATIAEAVTDLNAQGVTGGGGVTFNVAAGHTESVTAPITINSTVIGSASDPIVFQKDGIGNNPLVTRTDAGTLSTSTLGGAGDAVIRIEGTDYVTFDGIDVASDLQGIEYGYLTHKPSGTDGCQFITISNCKIDMTKGTSGYVVGVYIGNGTILTSSSVGITVTASSGRNTNITITGNTIQDVHAGIYMRGSSAAAYRDDIYTIGQVDAGNTIQNFGSGNVSTTYGIYFIYVNNPSVEYNIINNAGAGGSSHGSSLYGIFYSTVGGDVKGNNNQFTLSNSSALSATQYIYNGNLVTSNNFNNNTFSAGTISSTGTVYLIYASSGTLSNTISGNQTSGSINRTGASGTFYCFYNNGSPGSGSENIYNNNFSNITLAGSSTFYCINSTTAAGHTQNVYDNTISNITLGTGTFYGTNLTAANTRNVYNNSVYNVTSSGTIYGLSSGTGANPGKIYNNEVHDLTSSSTTATLYGIYCSSGTAVSLYNNYIYRLYAPLSGSTTGLAGIYIGGGTAINLYYNSIYLDASSSGANFGASGIYASTTPTLELRNNAVINNSTPAGTGYVVAYRRSTATLTTYSAASENNDFYAGPPSPNNLIFYDGTTPQQTIADFKTLVAPRDANSFSENPPFEEVSSAPYDLHIQTAVATQCESGGVAITGITDDFDGDLRQDPPDVGADEFEGTPAAVCAGTPADSDIEGPVEVCYNTGATLSLSILYTDLGLSFQWEYSTTPGGPYTITGANAATLATGNLTNPIYYICTITCTNSGLSFTTDEFGISVNPLPTVTVDPTSGTYCKPGGTPVTLTASGATSYSWSPATGLNVTTGPVVIASPAATTTYTVTGTDANGCINTASATITVLVYPVISSVTATPDVVCSGNTSQLQVSVLPTQANTYSFSATSGSFTPLVGGTVVPALKADDVFSGLIPIGFTFNYSGGSYTDLYANSNGFISFNPVAPSTSATNARTNSMASPVATLLPMIAPLWDDLDGSATGGISTPSYLTSGPPGNRVFTFEWLNYEWNWQSTDAVISFQVNLYEFDGRVVFIYREDPDVINLGSASIGIVGTIAGNFLSLDGTGPSPSASSTVATNTLNSKPATGQVYTFTPPQFNYSWSPAAGLSPNANVANPVTPPIFTETIYTVTVSNGVCSVSDDVTVSLPAPLSAAVNSPFRCTADITTAITGVPTGGAPPFTYTWSPVNDLYVDAAGTDDYDGSALDSPTIYTKAYTPITYYGLTITDNCGTTATATSTVTVYTTPTASAASNGPVCSGETLELYGFTDIGTSFSWTGPNGFTSDQQNPMILLVTMAANGTYYFTATANGCPSAAASVLVTIYQTPAALIITPDVANICPGSVQQLVASGGTIPNTMLLTEDFNGLVPGWTTINESYGGTNPELAAWMLYLPSPTFKSNDSTIFVMSNSDAQGSSGNTLTKLMTPVMNSTDYTSLTLSFWHFFDWYATPDTGFVEVSTDGGATWVYPALTSYKNADVGTATVWVNAIIDLSAYINQPNLQIRFRYKAIWGFWWAIDNVRIYGDKSSEITWSPFDKLYLDYGTTTPYAGEDAPTVYAKIYTTGTYTATATSEEGCTSWATTTITGVDYTVSGTLKYNNNAQTPMNNVTLTLNPGGYTAITDGGGNYLFEDICAGSYTIEVTNINKPVGGINSTDAVQMNVWNANQPPIQHVKFLAGEVDYDASVFINATDALAVQNYFVFGTLFNRADIFGSPWVFWKTGDVIVNNSDPNRFLANFPVDVVASDLVLDIYGQAIGDFSGSFTPGLLKSASATILLAYNETRMARAGVEFDLPVRMMNASSVSAVSLILNFPSDLVKVQGVSMNDSDVQPAWSVNGNELKIGWNSLQALWTGTGDEFLTIRVLTSQSFGEGDEIRFTLAADPLNEMADGNYIVIPDAVIGMDAVEFSMYGIGEPSAGSDMTLQSRPNPFADYTILNYTVPSDGHVTLEVNDMLGRKVSVPVDEFRSAGNYNVKLDAVPLQPGVYTATITLQNASGDMIRTIKLIRK